MSDQTKGVWCGRCHRDVEREPGSGTAWTLWICPYCRGSLGVRVRREDIGPVDTAALDTDYEPIFLDAYQRQMTAEFVLGPKGEHFDGDEWERRADQWHGRCRSAEAQLAREIGL